MTITYLLIDGSEVTEAPEVNTQYRIIGKVIKNSTSTRTFLATLFGSLIDVRKNGENEIRKYNSLPAFRQVAPEIYEKYCKYVRNENTKISIASLENLL